MKMDIEGTIQTMEDYSPAGLNLLIYGPPKVGKTSLCATAVEEVKTLYIDIEAGLASVVKRPVKFISISSVDADYPGLH